MKNSIPIIIGITGHRDLADEEKLKKEVTTILSEYKNSYASTQVVVLSALAEGADMLVARVAKELGLRLDVVLPYDEELYLGSFKEDKAKETFSSLKSYASDVKTLPCDKEKETSKVCYRKLGEYIADSSTILLALWDSVALGKEGGTSEVVKYARECYEGVQFDQLDAKAIVVLNTPRVSNKQIEKPYEVTKEYLQEMSEVRFYLICKKIDSLNSALKNQIKKDDIAIGFSDYFSDKAKKSQSIYKTVMLTILVLSFISVFSMEALHVLHVDRFMWGYGISLLLAFGIYHYFINKNNLKNNFIYSRGIKEALRVQQAWRYGGLDEGVWNYYLSNDYGKFTWIRVVLKNLNYLYKQQTIKADPKFITEDWIQEQTEYFDKSIKSKEEKLEKYEHYEKRLYRAGLVVLIVLFGWFMLEQFGFIKHQGWHYLVLASSLLLAGAAFLGEKFLKIEAYEEDIQNFKIMQHIYNDAQKLLENKELTNQRYKEIIKKLGIKALDENSKWVMLHDSRGVEISLE